MVVDRSLRAHEGGFLVALMPSSPLGCGWDLGLTSDCEKRAKVVDHGP